MMTDLDIERRMELIADGSTVIVQYWPDTGQWAIARSHSDGQRSGWAQVGEKAKSLAALF